jgi:hypothetical protein
MCQHPIAATLTEARRRCDKIGLSVFGRGRGRQDVAYGLRAISPRLRSVWETPVGEWKAARRSGVVALPLRRAAGIQKRPATRKGSGFDQRGYVRGVSEAPHRCC